MKVRISELRRYIREVLLTEENGVAFPHKSQPYIGNAMSPDSADREQLGSLATDDIDTIDDPEEVKITDHLREPVLEPSECWGPVPPTGVIPYLTVDPLARDTGPLGGSAGNFNNIR